MERAPSFIGTVGVPLVRQANISYLSELIPSPVTKGRGIYRLGKTLRHFQWLRVKFALIT